MKTIGRDFGDVARKVYATASGTLPNGKPVVVNADGTVSVAGNTSINAAVGTAAVFETGAVEHMGITYDSNSDRVVFVYKDDDNSDYGKAVVGQINAANNSISFGTPVIYSSANTDYSRATFDSSNNKVVVVYMKNTDNKGCAKVATVDPSDNSISFGSEVEFEQGTTTYIATTFDSNSNKVVVVFSDAADVAGKAVVGTVSGTSISFGTAVVFQSGQADTNGVTQKGVVFDSVSNKILIGYMDTADSLKLKAIVGTVSGTSISFGSAADTGASGSNINPSDCITFDSGNNRAVVVYRDPTGGKGRAIVGTVSGTSISFGTPVLFADFGTGTGRQASKITYDSNVGKIAIQVEGDGGKLFSATVSGTTLSFDSPIVYDTDNPSELGGIVFASVSKKVALAWKDSGNSSRGTASVAQLSGSVTTLTAENYIGMSSGGVVQAGSTGTAATFESAAIQNTAATFDSNSNKVVLTYQDGGNSYYGTAVVGSVSGSSITFGTPVVFESASNGVAAITFDSNSNKVVLAYYDGSNSNYGTSRVGTVSGTSISFGNAAVYESAVSYYNAIGFDSNSNKVVVAYRDQGNSNYGTAAVGTVSGTSISFGTPVVFNAGSVEDCWVVFDTTSNKIVILYKDTANSNYGTAIVGTVSGTSISFGSEVAFNSAATTYPIGVFDPSSGKVVIAFRDEGDSNNGKVMVGTVSGTSISFGSEVLYASGITANASGIALDSTTNQVILVYQDDTNGTVKTGTVSGTTINLSSATEYNAVNSTYNRVAYDSNNNVSVIAFKDGTNSNHGKALVFSQDIRGEVASGGAVLVNTKGAINTNQGGLTAGQSYFVQTDGTITTTAGDPSVFAGTAVSATKLIVKG